MKGSERAKKLAGFEKGLPVRTFLSCNEPCRPIYVGNFEYDATSREIEKLCERYGDLERVDMKTG